MLHEKLVGVIKTICEQRKTGYMVLKRKHAGGRTGYPHTALSILFIEYWAIRALHNRDNLAMAAFLPAV
jgi:hypothetical protein